MDTFRPIWGRFRNLGTKMGTGGGSWVTSLWASCYSYLPDVSRSCIPQMQLEKQHFIQKSEEHESSAAGGFRVSFYLVGPFVNVWVSVCLRDIFHSCFLYLTFCMCVSCQMSRLSALHLCSAGVWCINAILCLQAFLANTKDHWSHLTPVLYHFISITIRMFSCAVII